MLKNSVIILAFGGGLIPAAVAANKSMLSTMTGSKSSRDLESASNYKGRREEYKARLSLDPTSVDNVYVGASDASGPDLKCSPLLFSSAIKLSDIIAVLGRIKDVDSVADWSNLPSTKAPDLATPDKPPMWLPRSTFKTNIRKAPFTSWPNDELGAPCGGADLRNKELKRVKSRDCVIPDDALDAVFDTWAWGASVATPDKVSLYLGKFRPDSKTLDLGAFQRSAVLGRSVTGLAILAFVLIQVSAYGVLFVAPFLREFVNLDIGFGTLGTCNPGGCATLF
ncbi:hypothetical protein TrRE_jg12472 [Triparma retinervis]|uniref:Uncharacterized protein n=1 Tax=Triparma retinervis TaxID=2557542 RepID=A0A9W7AEW7_9STRA|nr:hypothetical protein TrRE_jg12472 [Triparma retinervis]